MKLGPQIEGLYQILNRELEYFPAGSRFHSTRELIDKYKCHRGILDETLNRLEREKLITRVPRIGIFSNVTRGGCRRRILLALPDWPGQIGNEWGAYARNYADTHPNWILRKTLLQPEQALEPLNFNGYDCAIVFIPDSIVRIEDMRQLSTWKIPVIFLNISTGSFQVSSVCSDDASGAMLACKYLYDHGHRKTALLLAEPHTYTIMTRVTAFRQAAGLLGMTTAMIDCKTQSGEFAPQNAKEAIRAHLIERDGKLDFTALYADSGEVALGAMQAFRDFGYELPDDVSIISHTSERIGEFSHPPLTAVCANLHAEVAAAFEGLEKILKGKATQINAMIPMKIIERSSVKAL